MLTNENSGTITKDHKDLIIKHFGEKGEVIADKLAADPQATMLGLLFENFSK